MKNILGKVTSVKSDENGLYIRLEPSEEGKRFFYELFKKEEEQAMTCRDKLALIHPEKIGDEYLGKCRGCPDEYGFLKKPKACEDRLEPSPTNCAICWDREIPEEKPKEAHPWGRILEFIDDAMSKRDREVHLYFNPDTGITMNVYPWPDTNETCESHEKELITANMLRRMVGLDPIQKHD